MDFLFLNKQELTEKVGCNRAVSPPETSAISVLYCRTGDDANHSYMNPAAYVLTLNRFYYSGLADCFNRLCFYLPGSGKTPQAAAAAYGFSQIPLAQL